MPEFHAGDLKSGGNYVQDCNYKYSIVIFPNELMAFL